MANTKQVLIEGELNTLGVLALRQGMDEDWALSEAEANNIPAKEVEQAAQAADRIRNFLASTVMPHYGLKVTWTGRTRDEGNSLGGTITYFEYRIIGQEAVSFAGLEALKADLAVWGRVHRDSIHDIEG